MEPCHIQRELKDCAIYYARAATEVAASLTVSTSPSLEHGTGANVTHF